MTDVIMSSASFFLALLLTVYVLFGLFEAVTTPRLAWYKRAIIVVLWPIMYLAAWLDEREY